MVKKITKFKIVSLYVTNYGKSYYLREIASLLKKPHQTLKPYLEILVSEGILIKEERKNITEYSLNFKNKRIYDYLVIAEKERLIEKLKEDIHLKTLFEKLSVYFEKNIFIIFGSSVDKIQKETDIDLLIIGKNNISEEIKNFEKIYNRKIHKIQIMNIEKLTSTFIKEIYKKHLIFNNTEQIIRFFGGLYGKNKLV